MNDSRNTVSKALLVLFRLVESGRPLGIQSLASETGLNASTVHRLLQTLVVERMASYDAVSRAYSVGGESIRFATMTLGGRSPVGRMRPVVQDVARRLGETCAFYRYEPTTRTMVATVVEHGPKPLGYSYDVGERSGVHAGASGRAILAFLPGEDIDAVLAGPLERLTENTYVEPKRLRAELGRVVERGYAVSHSERSEHGCGVAVPVVSAGGRVVGSLGLSIPKFRFQPARAPRIAKALVLAAKELAGTVDFDGEAML
jgi:DNA-binding IclR family transcriptional regulator